MRSGDWPRRHSKAIERGCAVLFFLSSFLLFRGALIFLLEGSANQGFGLIVFLIGGALMACAVLARLYFGAQINPATPTYIPIHTPYPAPSGPSIPAIPEPEPIVFSRPHPAWGEPGALADFETYLRAQFAPALSQATPEVMVIYKLVDYLIELFEDAFPEHDVLAQVTLPRNWEISDYWHEDDGNILPNRGAAWLKLRRGEPDLFEIAYQTFGQDTTVMRFPVAPDAAKEELIL